MPELKNNRILPLATSICTLIGLWIPASINASEEESKSKISFSNQVRPILNKHCSACHGGVKQAAGISFSYKEQVVAPEGWIVEPGEPDDSELIARIISDDPDEVMPPPEHGSSLTKEEVEVLRQWISEGATWEAHWAYVKPKPQSPPKVENSKWCLDPIDHFVLRRLEDQGLEPSAPASPQRWLRRVTLDLIGLPPTPEQRESFLSRVKEDSSEQPYVEVVDRLLASPHFGERWASVWLDQVRYADSKGLGSDSRRNIWKYRDWVIDAFNSDMPFDQFTIKQLAGDLLPERKISDLVATAANRLTQTNEEGGTDDEEFRVAAVLDRVNTTWQTWQGVTFGCVQCHSHPYDPIRHEEFYKFAAFFNNTRDCDLGEDWPVVKAPIDPDDYSRATALDAKIEQLRHKTWSKEYSLLKDAKIWKPVGDLNATTNKPTKVAVESVAQHDQFFTVDTISRDTDIELVASIPEDVKRLTAIRFTALPLDPEKAFSDSEWGFVLSHIEATIFADGHDKPKPIRFSHVISDEEDPFLDPQQTLNPESRQGFAAYTRINHPRQAVFVLDSPIDLPSQASIRVMLKHRYFILSSFSLVTRRGYLEVSDSDALGDLLENDEHIRRKKELSDLKSRRAKIKSTTVPVLRELNRNQARPTHVFVRGLFLTKADQVSSGTPAFLPPIEDAKESLNRLDLARWIATKDNPLTARVAVNRIWARLFGTGIVATEEDFGSSGEFPSHPQLLDFLADSFQNTHRWSTKKLLRQIALSATYRQSSKARTELLELDPQNRLLATGPRFRLPSEVVRDQALAISGLLNLKMAGPPVRPPIPDGVWNPFSGGDKWETADANSGNRYRRSIYTYTKRSIPYPMFAAFDAPSREFCAPRRLRSNTPIQALMTLNDQTFIECAAALGARIESSADNLEDQIRNGFLIATCRNPTEDELQELLALAQKTLDDDAQPDLSVIATVLLNLDEVLVK